MSGGKSHRPSSKSWCTSLVRQTPDGQVFERLRWRTLWRQSILNATSWKIAFITTTLLWHLLVIRNTFVPFKFILFGEFALLRHVVYKQGLVTLSSCSNNVAVIPVWKCRLIICHPRHFLTWRCATKNKELSTENSVQMDHTLKSLLLDLAFCSM